MILARVIAWFLHAWRGTRYTEIDAYALYRAFPPDPVVRKVTHSQAGRWVISGPVVWVEVRDV